METIPRHLFLGDRFVLGHAPPLPVRVEEIGGRSGCACPFPGGRFELAFPDAAFDVVLNCYLLDLLEEGDIVRAVREFGCVLRPGGRLVTASMGEPVGGWRELWNWAYRWNPRLVGGCRPVSAARYFLSTDWSMEHEETLSQMGFRSEMSVAFKLPFREDG